MLAHIPTNRFIGSKGSSSPNFPEVKPFNSKHPLKPAVGDFHRLAVLMLSFTVILTLSVGLGMRLLYPQPDVRSDDLSGYEAFMPGEIFNPEDYAFHLIPDSWHPEETNLDQTQTNTYIDSSAIRKLVVLEISYQQKQIGRFTFYSMRLRLLDLLWRWGRPDYKQKDIRNHCWVIKWFKQQYTVSITCRKLNLENPIEVVTITLH